MTTEIKQVHSFYSSNNSIKIEVEDQEGESWIFRDKNMDGFVDEISNTTSSSFDGDYFQIQELFQEAVWKAMEKANHFLQALAHKGSIQLTTGFSAHVAGWEPIYSNSEQYVGSLDKGTLLFLNIARGDNLKKLRLEPNDKQGHFEFDVDGNFLDGFPFFNQAVNNLLKKAEHVKWCKSKEAERSNELSSNISLPLIRDKVESNLLISVERESVEKAWLFAKTKSGSESIWRTSISSDEFTASVQINHLCSLPSQTVELSNYHFHPMSNVVFGLFETLIPSQNDIASCVKSALLLVHEGYHGAYDSRIATPLGYIILRPNLNLLRDNPDQFWNSVTKIPSVEAEARRWGLEQSGGTGNVNMGILMGYIQSINSEAIVVEFKLSPNLREQIGQ